MRIGPLRLGKEVPSGEPGGVDGRLIYVIGDVHGCYELLKDLLARLAADIEERAGARCPELIFLGDYVDRGPDSSKVLDALIWLQRRADLDVRLLKGNHEQALLEFFDAPDLGGPWIDYGGAQTLESYEIDAPPPGADPPAYARARDDLLDKMPASHLRLLQGLELMILAGDYAFVHAGIRPGAPLDRQAEEDLLWIRQDFLDAPGPFDKIIVHGHTWTSDQPVLLPHRIGVDTGAYATGVLTALRLEDHDFGILQARTAAPPST
jgi:serine/threonine protein phosphatase 1